LPRERPGRDRRFVNLKRGTDDVGAFDYDSILGALRKELDALIAARA
jgi:hypothetical protein